MRKLAIATLSVALVCSAACRSETAERAVEAAEAAPLASRVSFAVADCSFEKYAPASGTTLSASSKALMSHLGTAVLNQPNGSMAKLACPQGDAFPGWVDSDGNAVSALYGVSWLMTTPSFTPGQSSRIALWEMRDGEWWQLGRFADVSKDGKAYTLFAGSPIAASSRRLLQQFGIAVEGEESPVHVLLGDRSGTGRRDADGSVEITDDRGWSPPAE